MYGFDQKNSNHDKDLWDHTISTVENIKKVEGISEREVTLLKVAAFLHDIGKPDTQTPNDKKPGEFRYIGHAKKSAELAEPILDELGYSEEEEKNLILKLIEHHDDFISLDFTSEPSKKEKKISPTLNDEIKANRLFNNKALAKLSTHELKLLTVLCEADIRAQHPEKLKDKLEKLDIIKGLIKQREKVEEIQHTLNDKINLLELGLTKK